MSNRVTWGDGAYASFWLRVAARLIDWLLVGVVTGILSLALLLVLSIAVLAGSGFETGNAVLDAPVGGSVLLLLMWIAVLLVPEFLYDSIMTSRFGWTLGKRAVGIEVRGSDGDLLSFGQAAGRYLGRLVSTIPFFLGYLWAAWDPRVQTWHDKFVNSFVVVTARLAPAGATAPAARPWGGQAGWGIPSATRPVNAPATTAGREAAGAPEDAVGRLEGAAVKPEPVSQPSNDFEPSPGPQADVQADLQAGEPHAEPAGMGDEWARELDWGAGPEPTSPIEERTPPEPEPTSPIEGWTPPEPGPERAMDAGPDAEPIAEAGPEPPVMPAGSDPNLVAVGRAGLSAESAAWLEQVAHQVDARLDRVAPAWRDQPHAEAARACAYGLLLGHLASIYPHMHADIAQVTEEHPSFSTLGTGDRLATLQQIVADPRRAAAWVGPLVGTEDPDHVRRLLD